MECQWDKSVHVFAGGHQAGLAREQGTMKQVRGPGSRVGVHQEGRGLHWYLEDQ